MTLVNIDLRNVGYETGPDDRVVFYSPANRNEQGTIISTAETSVPLVAGQAEKELAPGPVVVQILAQGVADTRPKSGYVPEEGPVSLWDVVLDWTPALVDQGILAILTALDDALGQVAGAVAAEMGNTTHVIATGTAVHANKVVRLDANGKLAIGAGAVTDPTDPVSKSHLDTVVNTKADRTHEHNSPDIADATFYAGQVDNRFAGKVVKLNTDGKLYIHPSSITAPTDPANKGYVDTKVGDATQYISSTDDRFANKLVKLGSNGKLSINTSSITDLTDPVNKQYVDGAVTVKADRTHQHNAVDITGTTQYASYVDNRFANQLLKLNSDGKLSISTAGITDLTDPVNKQYVDSKVGNSAGGGRLLWWN